MPVTSADGRAWSLLAVMQGMQAKSPRRIDGTIETPSKFLPPNVHCVYREEAGVDTNIFVQGGTKFVEEAASLLQRVRRIVLTLDGYGTHVSLKVLKMFCENEIVVVGLPAPSSYRTQPLGYAIFRRTKQHSATIWTTDTFSFQTSSTTTSTQCASCWRMPTTNLLPSRTYSLDLAHADCGTRKLVVWMQTL